MWRNFFKKKETTNNPVEFKNDTIIITIGLTRDYDVDVSVEIQDLDVKNHADMIYKAQKIAQFFQTVTSGGINYTLTKILMEQIGDDPDYKNFIDTLVYNWIVLEKKKETEEANLSSSEAVVPPSDVFGKYTTTE